MFLDMMNQCRLTLSEDDLQKLDKWEKMAVMKTGEKTVITQEIIEQLCESIDDALQSKSENQDDNINKDSKEAVEFVENSLKTEGDKNSDDDMDVIVEEEYVYGDYSGESAELSDDTVGSDNSVLTEKMQCSSESEEKVKETSEKFDKLPNSLRKSVEQAVQTEEFENSDKTGDNEATNENAEKVLFKIPAVPKKPKLDEDVINARPLEVVYGLRWIQVKGLAKRTTVEEVMEHLKVIWPGKKFLVVEIHVKRYFSSFKIGCKELCYEELLNLTKWPEGAMVEKFKNIMKL